MPRPTYVRSPSGPGSPGYMPSTLSTSLKLSPVASTATTVDAEMVNYMRAHAIAGPWPAQDRLLRAIEYGEVTRIGASRPIEVDVRIVAATNEHLPRLVEESRFRADLDQVVSQDASPRA